MRTQHITEHRRISGQAKRRQAKNGYAEHWTSVGASGGERSFIVRDLTPSKSPLLTTTGAGTRASAIYALPSPVFPDLYRQFCAQPTPFVNQNRITRCLIARKSKKTEDWHGIHTHTHTHTHNCGTQHNNGG